MKNKHFYFVWDNFGPIHIDRIEAVARAYPGVQVTGLEIHGRSQTYAWNSESAPRCNKVTLFPQSNSRGLALLRALIRHRIQCGRAIWFLCHYDWKEILLFAFFLRLLGDQVFTMADSKFDDYQRNLWRELGKKFFLLPYKGALGASARSRDYLRFLGIKPETIVKGYDTLSTIRIRALAGQPPAPNGTPFSKRHFSIVARLVPKKNLFVALKAYSLYAAQTSDPRPLHLCGNGPLEAELRAYADELRISALVVFHGFIQTDAVARLLGSTLALILPSTEEQFGQVVPEALAMGLPIILSDNCGARDELVRTGVNGFVVESDNAEGMASFMILLATDEALWRRMCIATARFMPHGDVTEFTKGVAKLAGINATYS